MRNRKRKPFWILREFLGRFFVIVGAVILTLVFFLVLPLMQTLAKPPTTDLIVQSVDTAKLEAPEPPPEIEPEKKPEPEEKPPELTEDAPPLDLSQLELVLNPGFSEGMMGGDFAINLKNVVSSDRNNSDSLFNISDLDQAPRVLYQPSPRITKEMRKKLPGKVYVIFVVNEQGKLENLKIQSSSDPVFERETINAVKKYKFEKAKYKGKVVRFKMRIPIIFPKG